MAKKSKLGTPADALTRDARAAANQQNNNTRYHLQHGASEEAMNTELSETTGQSPEERFKSRGTKEVFKTKRQPTHSWF
jgi:hypothetical protein